MLKTLAGKQPHNGLESGSKYKQLIETPDGPRTCFQVTVERDRGRKPLVHRFSRIPLKRQRTATLTDLKPMSGRPYAHRPPSARGPAMAGQSPSSTPTPGPDTDAASPARSRPAGSPTELGGIAFPTPAWPSASTAAASRPAHARPVKPSTPSPSLDAHQAGPAHLAAAFAGTGQWRTPRTTSGMSPSPRTLHRPHGTAPRARPRQPRPSRMETPRIRLHRQTTGDPRRAPRALPPSSASRGRSRTHP